MWGFTAVIGLFINIPAFELVFYRTLIASLCLAPIVFFFQKKETIEPRTLWELMLTGFFIQIHWTLFFASARVSTASISLVGLSTITFWTSILEPIFRGYKIKKLDVFLGIITIVGIVIIFKVEFQYTLGLILAILSALFGACFTVLNTKLSHKHHYYIITFYELAAACLSSIILMPFYSYFFTEDGIHLNITLSDFLWLLVLALVCSVYAFSVEVKLIQRLSAFTINLIVNLEPLYGIILAVLVFGDKEKMNEDFYLGGAIILSAVLAYPFLRNYSNKMKQ